MPYILSVSRITIDTSSVKKHFTATESFTYSGLIVWAHYDYIYNNIQDAIDPQNVTSSAVVTATPWKPGIISVSVKYVDPQSGKSFFKYYLHNSSTIWLMSLPSALPLNSGIMLFIIWPLFLEATTSANFSLIIFKIPSLSSIAGAKAFI